MCENYINCWMSTYILVGLPNYAIMFCRFIYCRFAHGLVNDESKLFTKLILVATFFFTLHWLLVWPVQYTLNAGTNYENTIKGRICTQSLIPEFLEKSVNIKFSVKPKLLSFSMTLITLFSSVFFYKSSQSQRKRYNIPSHRRNLMDMDGNLMFIILIDLNVIADQVLKIPLEIFYAKLGVEYVFKIW